MQNESKFKITSDWYTVAGDCDRSDIVIVEGYEFSGKNLVMQDLDAVLSKGAQVYSYRADYSLIDYTELLPDETRFTLRLQMLEMLGIILDERKARPCTPTPIFVLDRSFFSDYVYLNLMGKATPELVTQIYDAYHALLHKYNVTVVHVSPAGQWLEDLSNQDEFKEKYKNVKGYYVKASQADFLYSVAFEDYLKLYPEDPITFIRYIKSEGNVYEDII